MRKVLQQKQIQIEDLIEEFGKNKSELSELKTVVDEQSTQLKQFMTDNDITTAMSENYKVLLYTYQKQAMDTDKLLAVLKKHNLVDGIIKTKEYIDMDALESALYKNSFPNDVLMDIDKCKTSTDVTSIRLTKKKVKK